MRLRRISTATLWVCAIGLLGIGIAYGAGIPNHVLNGVQHGCPLDPGCADDQADGIRHGYNRTVDQTRMEFALVSVNAGDNLDVVDSNECQNCERVDIQVDLSGLDIQECELATFHFEESRDLEHYHYTADGPC